MIISNTDLSFVTFSVFLSIIMQRTMTISENIGVYSVLYVLSDRAEL